MKKNYFAVTNLIFTYDLDAVAIAIYVFLIFNSFRRWNYPLVNCKKLSEELHASEKVISKRIRVLVSKKLIEVDEGYLFVRRKMVNRPWGFWLLPKVENFRNIFLLPNELFTLNLCAGEIAVYAYLRSCEDRDTYQCYPGYKTIGEATGMSRGTVKKYVDSLVDKRLIYTEPTSVWGKGGKKRNGNLLYTIRPIADAVAFCVESGFGNLTKRGFSEVK